MSNNNKIELKFEYKSVVNLAGYLYGHNVYDTQIKDHLDVSKDFAISFPGFIVDVSSSFVQGLFAEIIKNIGLLDTINRLSIISPNSGFEEKVKERLK